MQHVVDDGAPTPDQMARIAVITKEVQSAPGEWIVNESKPIDALYVIMDGSVELRHGEEPLSRVGPGHVIGMWAIFEDADLMPVTAKARLVIINTILPALPGRTYPNTSTGTWKGSTGRNRRFKTEAM